MVSSEAPTDCSPNHEISSESSRISGLGTSSLISPRINNNDNSVEDEKIAEEIGKQPSYVSLARCISGYTTLTTYNSKQREGFRSRDISPARLYHDLSPRRGDNGSTMSFQGTNHLTVQPRYLTDMDHRSDISGDESKNGNPQSNSNDFVTSSNIMSSQSNGCVNKFSSSKFTNVGVSESCYSHESHSFSISSSTSCNLQGMKLSSEVSSSPKCSFIVQRVERLYGPGALAQGFYTRPKTHSMSQCEEKEQEQINNNDVEESLPVLRLLRPEFRAQLSLAKRKSTSNILSPRNEDRNGVKERIIPIEMEEDQPDLAIIETKSDPVSSQKDGHFYLQLVDEEVKTLQRLAGKIEAELEPPSAVPEEFAGRLRAAAGKARLLASQKLAQFQGLCKKNINRDSNEHFPTTSEDLAGFWDMVSIQINNVHEEFDKINALKASGWIQDPAVEINSKSNGATPVRRTRTSGKTNVVSGKVKSSSSGNKARDEERKRLIEERRKEMRKNLNQKTNEDTLFVCVE